MSDAAPTGRSRFVSHSLDDVPVREGQEGADFYALMTDALHELVLERGLVTQPEIDAAMTALQTPRAEWGAHIIVRAWRDPAYRARLLENGIAAAAELGYRVKEAQLVVVENTPALHNLVVCTLCSCYPRSLLGPPPWWYVSKSYRARAVREPRAVLAEFGLIVPEDVEVRVHDSNADLRYLVLPMPPDNAAALDDAALMALVTRDAMIGAAQAGGQSSMPYGRGVPAP